MNISVHVYHHDSPEIISLLNQILTNQEKNHQELMATKADFQAKIDSINESTNNIAADITNIKDQLAAALANGGVLTEADAEDILGQLDATATKLTGIAAETPE